MRAMAPLLCVVGMALSSKAQGQVLAPLIPRALPVFRGAPVAARTALVGGDVSCDHPGTMVGAVAKGIIIGLAVGTGALTIARPDGLGDSRVARRNASLLIVGSGVVGGLYMWVRSTIEWHCSGHASYRAPNYGL